MRSDWLEIFGLAKSKFAHPSTSSERTNLLLFYGKLKIEYPPYFT